MRRYYYFLIFALVFGLAYSNGAEKKLKPQKGATVYGVVSSAEGPLAGVPVTDGKEIVYTNSDGVYNLKSTKADGLVYITTPKGYEPQVKNGVVPSFWAHTTLPAKKAERVDFTVNKVDNTNFTLFVATDIHLCNDPKRKDLKYFSELAMPAIRQAYEAEKSRPVYSIFLGDITWDRFWYETGFDLSMLPSYLSSNNYPTMTYTLMGNHDNDAAVPHSETTDYDAEKPYRKVLGPTYYSINIGDVHFLVLDDIIYKNEPKQGQIVQKNVAGSRNYDLYVSDRQMEWIRKDLSVVDPETPVVVCMHAPLFVKDVNGKTVFGFSDKEKEAQFLDILAPYKNVKVFTGHKHKNFFLTMPQYPNIREYTLSAVCGELWKTISKTTKNFCDDGSDAGFYVCHFDGKDFSQKFFSEHRGYVPFRVYDMNEVGKYYADPKHRPVLAHACELLKNQKDYSLADYKNYVYINCWDVEPGSKLVVMEDGKELAIEKVADSDPNAAIVLISPSFKKKKKGSKTGNLISRCEHMYRVLASSETSALDIKFLPEYGEEITMRVERPYAFPEFSYR